MGEHSIRPLKRSDMVLAIVCAIALVLSAGLKVHGILLRPLWLDEAWTGAIVGQSDLRRVAQLMRLDVNAPLYYGLMAIWRCLFGLSDLALRMPSFMAALVTPLAPLLGLRERSGPFPLTRADRFVWAGLLALWPPSLTYADEARCYALLLLIITLQAVALIRLVAKPGLRRAFAWSSLSALAVLTHYDALFVTAFEGFFLVAALRRALPTLWPSALVFVPAAGWFFYHLPRVLAFAQPGVAWYPLVDLKMAPAIIGYIIGSHEHLIVVPVIIILTAAAGRSAGSWPNANISLDGRIILLAASVLSAATLAVLGVWRPSFTFRYLVPSAPGCLLGLALVLGWLGHVRAPWGRGLLLGLYIGIPCLAIATGSPVRKPEYSFETASAALRQSRPHRLIFYWDNPNSAILKPEQLQALGGVFFDRLGDAIPVVPIYVPAKDDPNRVITADLRAGDAVLWLYDLKVLGTRARMFPPALNPRGGAVACRQYAGEEIGVLACLDSLSFKTP